MHHRRPFMVLSILALFSVLLTQLSPARADGGPIVPDPGLWAQIDEGQQIAVIHLGKGDTAQVDLFITLVDRSGKSHQVIFFIPLGKDTRGFNVVEERSRAFYDVLAKPLDEKIHSYVEKTYNYKRTVRAELFLGTLLTNGVWTWLLGLPLFTSSCSQLPQPKATFSTSSSNIAIYEMNEGVDIDALIATTGLAPGVKDTLQDLRGQEIAVITLQTQPATKDADRVASGEETGQPGIHLAWNTTLAAHPEGSEYIYPLGTGRAWASPIKLTRVYVVAPPGTDFKVQYPTLGDDLSGIESGGVVIMVPQILWSIDYATSPAFAIDEAYGSFGRIWRATFVKSNSDRDISVIKLAKVSNETRSAIRQSQFHALTTSGTWIISLLVGVAIWLFSWWLVMTRVGKIPYRWREARLYKDAFLWSVLYPLTTLGILVVILLPTLFIHVLSILVFVLVPIGATGFVNAFFFSRSHSKKLAVPMRRLFGSYMLTVLLANILYAVFAFPYAILVGGL